MAKTVNIESIVKVIGEQLQQLVYREKFLVRELSTLDKTTNDIEHYLEFEDFGVADTLRLAMKLQRVLRARRAIKNELRMCNEFKATLSMKVEKYPTWLEARKEAQDNLEYKPRVVTLDSLLKGE